MPNKILNQNGNKVTSTHSHYHFLENTQNL